MNKYIRTLELVNNGWLVNGKYLIDNQGVVWYNYNYLGYRKDFPSWLFELRNDLLGK